MSPLSIILADDHAAVRKSLRLLLECESDIEVAAETTDGPDTIRAVQALQPDLLLLDIKMPLMNGLEVLQYLRNEKHPVGIILLSNHSDQLYVAAAQRLGADAFLTKSVELEALLETIRIVGQRVSRERKMRLEHTVGPSAPRAGPLLAETAAKRGIAGTNGLMPVEKSA